MATSNEKICLFGQGTCVKERCWAYIPKPVPTRVDDCDPDESYVKVLTSIRPVEEGCKLVNTPERGLFAKMLSRGE
jgi:hypothetical protein